MPYIPRVDRNLYDPILETLARELKREGAKPGHLNYCVSRLLWLFTRTVDDGSTSYIVLCAARGAVDDASAEFYRRVMGPYEDDTRQKHGDVFND